MIPLSRGTSLSMSSPPHDEYRLGVCCFGETPTGDLVCLVLRLALSRPLVVMRLLIPQESAEPSVQSLVDRPRRTGGRPKAGPPAYAKPSARMCPIEESRLSTPFQPACGRACREVGWSGRWETKTQAGPQRTGQASHAPSNGVSPKAG